MATDAKLMKFERSTQEQLQFYVDFCQRNPLFQCGKNNPREPKMMQNFWEELAAGMNSLRGPTRTSEKWKETLANWKNQLRTRARKIKMDQRTTGGGPNRIKNLTEFEERALSTFGSAAVDGNAEISTIGMQHQVCSTNVIQSNSPNSVSFEESVPCSPLVLVPTSPICSAPPSPLPACSTSTSSICSAPPSPLPACSTSNGSFCFSSPPTASYSSSCKKRKLSAEDMFGILLKKIEKKEERENEMLVAMKLMNESLAEILKQRNK